MREAGATSAGGLDPLAVKDLDREREAAELRRNTYLALVVAASTCQPPQHFPLLAIGELGISYDGASQQRAASRA